MATTRTRSQIGKLSRDKGGAFERKIAKLLRKEFPGATVHRTQQADRAYESDLVVEGCDSAGIASIWWELNDARQPNPRKKLLQAERDVLDLHKRRKGMKGDMKLPVVVWHRFRQHTINATLTLPSLIWLAFGTAYGNWGTPEPVTLDLHDLLAMIRRQDLR